MKLFLKKIFTFSIISTCILILVAILKIHVEPFEEFSKLKKALNGNTDVINFGSSVDFHAAESDIDKRSISQMLDSNLIDYKVEGISGPAYHAEIFVEFVRYISNTDYSSVIAIPINLRSLAPSWDIKPEYQFIKERHELRGIPYFTNILGFREFSQFDLENQIVYHMDEKYKNVKDVYVTYRKADLKTKRTNGFILNYMQPISKGHIKLQAFQNIISFCNANDIELILYIPPIDYSTAQKLNIEGFTELVSKNINNIKTTLTSDQSYLIDMSMSLDSTYFDWEIDEVPNEHLNAEGRQFVADALSKCFLTNFDSSSTTD
ncbi:MAG: hypothetical protein ACI9JN_001775 [Bacteroidia bacterium]|jgi:hypothetical protein